MFGLLRASLIGKHAPHISGTQWFNVDKLPADAVTKVQQHGTIQISSDLEGYVVLIDFWDLASRSCLEELDHVRKFYAQHADRGVLVIGVHTPEFAYEQNSDKVESAVLRFGLSYPVVNDAERHTWDRYKSKQRPRRVVVDQTGIIRLDQNKKEDFEEIDNTIQGLLDNNT